MKLNWTQTAPYDYQSSHGVFGDFRMVGMTGVGGDLYVDLYDGDRKVGQFVGYSDAEYEAQRLLDERDQDARDMAQAEADGLVECV